jgi:tRNA A-37 threonylcarbamoyl transferase component Bud32
VDRHQWPEIPGYELNDILGMGGFGVVFLAEEVSLIKKKRAIKVCWPTPLQSSDGVEERFIRESKTLASLSHPQLVSYVNSGFTSGLERKPFVVMEFVEGKNLQRGDISSIEQACVVVLSLLDTLEYCHSKSVIHRDIKPSNIIIRTVDSAPVLVDFGLSISIEYLNSRVSKEPPGSPGYMAPELIANPLMVDVKLDIYSVGVLLYELIASSLPDPLSPVSLTTFNSEADSYLDEIVRSCLLHYSQRLPSVNALRERLSSWLELHRQKLAHAKNLSARAQALRKGFTAARLRQQKDQETVDKFAGAMKKLSDGQVTKFANQVLLAFEEAVGALRSDVPDAQVENTWSIHLNSASKVVDAHAAEGEVLDLIKISANKRELVFSVLKFSRIEHPWTKETLFPDGKLKDAGVATFHRKGEPSPKVMQPLFLFYSKDTAADDEKWLHLAILMVLDESFESTSNVDESSLRFLAEHHPMFTRLDNLLAVSSSTDGMQEPIWRVIDWFFTAYVVSIS